MKLKELKRGEFFTLKEYAEPKENQVWIKGEYDRSSKSYECTRFSDMNDYRYIKADRNIYIEFVF